ncbi:MAG TPA: putative collagen-binding domain-containing protein, partial [Thermoanaerobaculia bacterium]|nr:putative collagen-binding domain-containing protein [Thermoanaerobaculia bacterium]
SGKIYTARGFFDGDGAGGPAGDVFRIRLFADEHGTWTWTTTSNRAELHGKSGSFLCSGTLPGTFGEGPIAVDPARPRVFRHRNGRPVYLVGKFLDTEAPPLLQFSHTLFSEEIDDEDREAMVARQQDMGLNKMNVYVANKGDYQHISTTPWIGTANNNDKTRFDLARWHLYESWVRRLRDEGMAAQLWFFADDSGFGDLPDADRKRLIEYGMARLSGYVNTLFVLALEWQEGWTPAEVATHAEFIHVQNPWDRLVSVHGTTGDFDFPTAAWADFMDIQAGNNSDHQRVHDLGLAHRLLAEKPLIQEEHGMGQEDMIERQKVWAAFISGAASTGTGAFLKPLARFVSTVRFERLEPSLLRVLSGGAYAAEDAGRFHVLYLYDGGPVLLDLLGVAGPLKSEWFDPRNGKFSPGPTLAGNGVRTVAPPDGEDWVMTLSTPPAPPAPSSFYTVTPCRALDTRNEGVPFVSAERRRVPLGGRCGVPATAKAVAANVTAVGPSSLGTFTFWPVGGAQPAASVVSFPAGKTRATAAILPLADDATLLAEPAMAGGAVHLILDVTGYFE